MCDVDTNTEAKNSIRVLTREIGQDQSCPLFFLHNYFHSSHTRKSPIHNVNILLKLWRLGVFGADFWNYIIARKISQRAPTASKVSFVVLSLIPRHPLESAITPPKKNPKFNFVKTQLLFFPEKF